MALGMRRVVAWMATWVFGVGTIMAQVPVVNEKNPIEFVMQIRQLDDFVQRFNLKAIPPMLDTTTPHVEERMLLSLFDYDYAETNVELVRDFIGSVLHHGDSIGYGSGRSWLALAKCAVKINQHESSVVLALRVEAIDAEMYKWVIVAAEGEPLRLHPKKRTRFDKIFPLENEVNFMQLASLTGCNAENILNYSDKDFVIDQTSVFYALVATGQLKIEYVEDLHYQFRTSDYTFWVKDHLRMTTNSGWLIYKLERNK